MASGGFLLLGGFLLWWPSVKTEVGVGGRGGRIEEYNQRFLKKLKPSEPMRTPVYPWRDSMFYAVGWVAIIIGTVFGMVAAVSGN